jgi:DMSO/TMAO reductase YedYZ molybdopterin-dependent catalytic subunit
MSLADRLPSPWTFLIALAAGLAGVGASYAVVGRTPSFVVTPISRGLTAVTPGAVITWAIQNLGSLGQQGAFLGALALTVGLFAAIALAGILAGRRFGTSDTGPRSPIGLALSTTGLASLAVAVLLVGPAGSALAAALAGTAVVGIGIRGRRAVGTEPASVSRRRAIQAGIGGLAVAGVGGALGRQAGRGTTTENDVADATTANLLRIAEDRTLPIAGIDGLLSGPGFYEVDINSVDPNLSTDDWTLSITGAVEQDAEVSYADLRAYEPEHRFVSLRCVGEPLNGKKLDNALWTGVPLVEVLEDATGHPLPDECCVMLRADDDFYEEFPVSALEDGFLAYGMDGARLPRGHGYPVRALIPGHWGEINVKWLTEIEILESPADGYWEKRGWHGTGPVETVAKLHAVNRLDDGRIEVAGHAYAGTRGISRVEVSTDGGETWADAELSERLPGAVRGGEQLRETAQDAWRQWHYVYDADEPHEVVVRATDAEGRLQPEEQRKSFPRGATGWVSQEVEP